MYSQCFPNGLCLSIKCLLTLSFSGLMDMTNPLTGEDANGLTNTANGLTNTTQVEILLRSCKILQDLVRIL